MNGLPHTAPPSDRIDLESRTEDPRVSVLVLVTGRPEPLVELYHELAAGVREAREDFEFLFVVDPAFAELAAPLLDLGSHGEPIKVIHAGQQMGETSLLRLGLTYCSGSIILTLPPRRRVEPAALGRLITTVEAGADMAVALRWPRRDSWIDRFRSRVFHTLAARAVTPAAAKMMDLTSGVRAMRRDLLDELPLYGDLARFLPLIAVRDGYTVVEVPASQHLSVQRTRLHSPVIYLRLLLDLFSLFFLLRFTEKPLRFFGLFGSATVLPGAVILAILFVQRLGGQALADRPLLLVGVLLVTIGIQMIALGLIGEIIVHLHAGHRQSYRVKVRQPDREQ